MGASVGRQGGAEASAGRRGGAAASTGRRHSLSVVVICCNEADRIAACLAPLAGWADQLVVLDSGSTDGTPDIVRNFAGVELHCTDWPGEWRQRQRSLDLARCDYVLVVDADEVYTQALKDEIDGHLAQESPPRAMRIPLWLHFMGRRIRRGRIPAPQLRLFRREGVRYNEAEIHSAAQVPGLRGHRGGVRLRQGAVHHSFRDYRHLWDKHLHYGLVSARASYARGKRSGVGRALLRGTLEFAHQYFLRGMFLDGWRGLLLAKVLADYAFHRYAGIWVLEQEAKAEAPPPTAEGSGS